MKLWRHFVAFLLGLAAALTGWAYISSSSLFNSTYLLHQADVANVYASLAAATPKLLGELAPLTAPERALLGRLVTPAFVKTRAVMLLPQLEYYYRSGGPRAALDLSELPVAASAAGLPLPATLDRQLQQPLVVSVGSLDPWFSQIIRWSDHLRVMGPIIIVVLLVLGAATGRRRIGLLLAEASLFGAAGALIVAGIVLLVPRLITSTVVTSAAKPLAATLTAWLQSVIAAPVHQLVLLAAGLATLALAAVSLHMVFMLGGVFHHPKKHDR